ncbi:UDP-N-acetylmuramoyl-L-alanine--D-glutamate ligase [Campylobacter ureolyticus]|uniref:UDP-N-acetylmuramoylalanine--D-glutamate ligase n=1 Tax=Campylobacter ureolyticus TaxID=827 RepID=A0A2I1N8I3_9BACT|nr:UDP-N-acetylmuramoyl-L-alanine--D-glutamate ligase [Campylobacter ureolyticus]PKZ28686.1 UDP-N-acetylmuramoyl-L-alanine--D-glutamate ligase [Campylobacter ureolyticus]
MRKSLFGYGKTTKAIARNVKFNGIWDIYDDKFIEISKDDLGNNLLPVSEFDPLKSTLEIPSPGFPRNHELVKKAKNLISEYDYFKDTPPAKIWISGTNGKTTTTQMAGLVLKNNGAVIGGNVGEPLANLNELAKFWILETSSFTIYYTKFAAPRIYALLPITPDHISWHGSFEEYEKTKLKPLSMMGKGSVAIIPKKYDDIKSKAKIYFYEDEDDLAKICGVNLKDVNFKVPFLIDALLALCIEKFATNSLNLNLLNTFKIDKNRVEEFKDSKNRLWVNDTKATNLDAVIQALKRYSDKKIHLILGGDDKGVDLTPLYKNFEGYNLEIYAIGSNALKILNLALKFNVKAHKCDFLQDAVKSIDISLRNDEVALLSPACASLDQFSSYEERGNLFKKFVQEL